MPLADLIHEAARQLTAPHKVAGAQEKIHVIVNGWMGEAFTTNLQESRVMLGLRGLLAIGCSCVTHQRIYTMLA